MTKELVKSENGHKIIKHARHTAALALSPLYSGPRIKMGFVMTPSLALLFLVLVVSVKSATLDDTTTTVAPKDTADETTDDEPLKTAETELSTDKAAPARNKSEDDDFTNGELTLEDLLLFPSLFGGDDDDAFDENSKRNLGDKMKQENPDDITTDSAYPANSKVAAGPGGIRRQGEVNPSFNQNTKNSEIQYDDANQDGRSNFPYSQDSQNFNRDNIQDEVVDLQLTEGGYNKPFVRTERPSSNNRFSSISDSSQRSEKRLEVPERSSNLQQQGRQILPQASYPIPPQFPFTAFRPMIQPPLYPSRRNVLPINNVMPAPNGLISTPPSSYSDYRTAGFQAQYPSSVPGVFSNFGQDPNNAALFQTSQRNPFQDTSLLFQSAPQIQSQPILVDSSGNLPPQFQQNPLSAFANFDNVDDDSRSNYAAFFGEPAGNPQFQVPPNFFGPNLNRGNPFNRPPVSFLPAIPNSQESLRPQLSRYIPPKDSQNQQNLNDQQPESDSSQEEKTTDSQDDGNARSNNEKLPFGARLQDDPDVYMRYPTIEAGYAVKENLPPRNDSSDVQIDDKQAGTEQRNFPSIDPYRSALNLLQSSQRINSSFGFQPPPPLFRDTPSTNFGYQVPPNTIMMQYPDRNRDLPSFVRPDFNPGNPFDTLSSLPENNYGFLRGDTQRRGNQEISGTPSCAKQNVSFCFEDSEYPSNAILFSLNSNALLIDPSLSGGSDQQLNSVQLVEKNASVPEQAAENYACPVDIKYGLPLWAKNVAGDWRTVANIKGKFSQSVRLEVCKSLGDPCKYTDSKVKTTCVQKYSVQRLVVWSPIRGVFTDLFKMPVACSCQILDAADLP